MQRADDIAAAAYNSSSTPEGAIALDFHAMTPTIKELFRKYGTTAHGYKDFTDPRRFAGYMRYNGSSEFIAVVFLSKEGTLVTSFWPGEEYNDDMASLLKKKMFFDEVISSIREEYRP